MRSLAVASLVVVCSLTASRPARATDCDDPSIDGRIGLGFLLPQPGCAVTIHGDVGFGFGTAAFDGGRERPADRVDVRVFAEAGVLVKPGEEDVPWDVGPVFFVAGMGHSVADESLELDTQQYGLLARSRWWSPEGIVTIDGGFGPTVSYRERVLPGVHTDLALRILGLAGAMVSYEHVFGSHEHVFTAGLTVTYGGAVMAVACAAKSC